MNAELARNEITFRQWEVLFSMALLKEPSQADLAGMLGIEAPTLAGILSRMERDGWLERFCCPQDKRKKRLRATPKAEGVFLQMVECCKRVRNRMMIDIPESDLQTVKATCIKICQNLGGKDPSEQVMSNKSPVCHDHEHNGHKPVTEELASLPVMTAIE
ncbi:MAG: MarR family winged helix-turn-helix transcriptional regulator [Planctomycetaceae bacterium]